MDHLLAELIEKGLLSVQLVSDLLDMVDRGSSDANHAKTTLVAIAKDPAWGKYRNSLDWNIRCDWFFRVRDVERDNYLYHQGKEQKVFDALYDLLKIGKPDLCNYIWEIIKRVPYLANGYDREEEYSYWLSAARQIGKAECPDNLNFLRGERSDCKSYWEATESTYDEPELFFIAIDYQLSSQRTFVLPFDDTRCLLRLSKANKASEISKKAINQNALSNDFVSELIHNDDSYAADDLVQLHNKKYWKDYIVGVEVTPLVAAQWLIRVAGKQEVSSYQVGKTDSLFDFFENRFVSPDQQQAALIDAVIQYIPHLPIPWDERIEKLGLWAEAAAKKRSAFRWIMADQDHQDFMIWDSLRDIRASIWNGKGTILHDKPLDLLFLSILNLWMNAYDALSDESSSEKKTSLITKFVNLFSSKSLLDEQFFDQPEVTTFHKNDVIQLVNLVQEEYIEAKKILESIVDYPRLVPSNVFTYLLKPNPEPKPDLAAIYVSCLQASEAWKQGYRDQFMFELEELEELEWDLFQVDHENSKLIPTVVSILAEDFNLPPRTLVMSLLYLLPYHPNLKHQEMDINERLKYFGLWMAKLNQFGTHSQYEKWFDLAQKFNK